MDSMGFMNAQEGFFFGLFVGLGFVPLGWLLWATVVVKMWRGWRLRIQTADDFEKAVRREVDKRWLDLEAERRLKIINLEVEERMVRERTERGAASSKRP